MGEANGAQQKEKVTKIRRKPEQESILSPTFAASRESITNSIWTEHQQQGNSLLQRQCACGTHTIGGRECDTCRQKREASVWRWGAVNNMPSGAELLPSTQTQPFVKLSFGRDFSQVSTHSAAMQTKQSSQFTPTSLNIQRGSEDAIVHESEFFVHGIFIQIDYDTTQVRPNQIRQLLSTLELIPPNHVQHVPAITVGNRPAGGGGGSAHSGMPGGPYIRLNRNCFNSSWNRGAYNETLLHEVGHIVDWAYECMRYMLSENPEGYRALLSHPHRGRTQGPGEHFADAYAAYYLGRGMSGARRDALLSSRAFQS